MCARNVSPGPHQCSWPIDQGSKGAAAASHPAGRRTDATCNHARGPWQIRPAAGLVVVGLRAAVGPGPLQLMIDPNSGKEMRAEIGPNGGHTCKESYRVGNRSDGRAVGLHCDPQDVPSAPL